MARFGVIAQRRPTDSLTAGRPGGWMSPSTHARRPKCLRTSTKPSALRRCTSLRHAVSRRRPHARGRAESTRPQAAPERHLDAARAGTRLLRTQRLGRCVPRAVARRRVDPARGRRSATASRGRPGLQSRRRDARDDGARLSRAHRTPATAWPPHARRSGSAFVSSLAATRAAPVDGSAGRNDWSSARAATAWNRVTCCCRPRNAI